MLNSDNGFTVTRSLAMNRTDSGAVIGIKGYLVGRIIRLEPYKRVLIGRDESQCDIVIKGDAVSRVHCSIQYEDDEYVIYDLSKNGILVDKKYMLEKKKQNKLSSGTTLFIGSSDNVIMLG